MNDMSNPIQLNKKLAEQAAVCDPGKCRTCERVGMPIMPLRYAVLPKFRADIRSKLPDPMLGQGVKDIPLEKHNYGLRLLREGYLYVYLEALDLWHAYAVTPQGHFTLLLDHTRPPVGATAPLDHPCVTKAHDVSASFIHIPDITRTPVIWLAFSQDPWTKKILDNYRKADQRAKRMSRLDLAAFKKSPKAQPHAFEITSSMNSLHDNVEEYARTEDEGLQRGGWVEQGTPAIDSAGYEEFCSANPVWSVHAFWSRHARWKETQQAVLRANQKNKMPVPAIALVDTAGIIAELNYSRTKQTMRHQAWASSEPVAHRRLSSDAIKGVREAIKNPIRADVDKRFDSKPQTKELRYHGAYVATVTTTPEQQVEHEARVPIQRLEKHYDEAARASFDRDYDKTVKKHADKLASLDFDYAAWLMLETTPGRPSLDFLCEHDFDEYNHACGAGYIKLVGQSVAGGPNKHSLAWFEKKLPLKISDPKQILQRALVGNQQSFFAWVSKEKPDEAYDEIKALSDAGKLDKVKWLAPAVAIYANPVLAAIGATAFVLNKDLSVNKALRDQIAHLSKIAIRLWDRLEVHTLKMRMNLGDYHQSLLRGAYPSATPKTGATPKETGKTRLAPKLKLPPALANKTADLLFWTTGKVDDILALMPKAPAQASATDWVEIANSKTQKSLATGQNAIRRALGPGRARELGATLIKRIDTVAGSKTGILAMGAMILQWHQLVENSATINSAGGDKAMSAAFGLGDASLSVISASFEITSVVKEKVGFDKLGAAQLMRVAAGFAAGAHMFNAAESFVKSANKKAEGDHDAKALYFASGSAFTGAAGFSLAIAFGAKATFFGPLLGLGPVGWGFICLGAALTLYYGAVQAEDNAAEKWLARNKFWSKSSRTEKRYVSWLEEAQALNILGYGIKADLTWSGKWIPGMDTVKMQIVIPSNGDTYGEWRYRMIATFNGNEIEIYNNHSSNKILPFPRLNPPRQHEMRAAPDKPRPLNIKVHSYTYELFPEPNRHAILTHEFDVDSSVFSHARLEFEYYEDVEDQTSVARIELACDAKQF